MGLFCKDVHIPSGDFALKFLQVLRNQSPFYNYYTHGGALLNQECRSLSFQCDRDGLVEAPYQCSGNGNVSDPTIPEHPMGIAIHTVLRALYFTPYFVPNLRRISILYNNSLMRDLFRRNNFTGFPPQVTELEIDFTYDPRTPLAVLDAISTNEDCIGLVPGSMRNVKLLHAIGLTQAALNELKLACSNWEEMEIESWRVGQDEDEKREEIYLEGTDSEQDTDSDFEADYDAPDVYIFTSSSSKPVYPSLSARKQRYIAISIISSTFAMLALLGLFALPPLMFSS